LGDIVTLLFRDDAAGWRAPSGFGYENEAALQAILHDHPTLVPGVRDGAVACREFESAVGPADVVIVDDAGEITLVECKLASNPQIRREVIGQVLDYASRLWRMSVDDFERRWKRADAAGLSPFEQLGDDEGRIRAAVQDNLNASRLKMVLAVDRLNDDLKRIVEFLNTIIVPSAGVIAVEFARVYDEVSGVEILMPESYGAELAEAKEAADTLRRPPWTPEQYIEWCENTDPGGVPIIRALISALVEHGFEIVGGQAATPSLNCGLTVPGLGHKFPVCLYTSVGRGALIEVRFTDFKKDSHREARLADFVEEIPNIPIPVDEVRRAGFTKRPNVPAQEFGQATVVKLADAVSRALTGEDPDPVHHSEDFSRHS
jgi:hypothetical protein